jgi:hypothetical protein
VTDTEWLEEVLAKVTPEHSLKLWALALAGKKGEEIAAVSDAEPSSRIGADSSPLDLAKHGTRLEDYLLRGMAIAVATGVDLESPLQSWRSGGGQTLDERAWRSFARQLALSDLGDWQAFSVLSERESPHLEKVYLRLAGKAWWSFRHVLDRPLSGAVERACKRLRSRVVVGESLRDLARRSAGGRGRALKRALRAIRARVGEAGTTPRPSRSVRV